MKEKYKKMYEQNYKTMNLLKDFKMSVLNFSLP